MRLVRDKAPARLTKSMARKTLASVARTSPPPVTNGRRNQLAFAPVFVWLENVVRKVSSVPPQPLLGCR
jgi:hypothetical protein